jgi:tetratricopeptide (TPR) repeat protein
MRNAVAEQGFLMPDDRRLDGWKAIGNHLGRDRTTAMRWARERGLPVHRVPGGRQGTVYSLISELDNWMADGDVEHAADAPPAVAVPKPAPRPRKIGWALATGVAATVLTGMIAWRGPAEATGMVSLSVAPSAGANSETRQFERGLTADLARFANASAGLAVYDTGGSARSNTQYSVRIQIEPGRNGLVAEPQLIARDGGIVLWTRRFEQAGSSVSELRARVAASIVDLLRCGIESFDGEAKKLSPSESVILISVCDGSLADDPPSALARAEQLAQRRPDLALSWAVLAQAQVENSARRDAMLMKQAKENARRAARISPEGYETLMALASTAGDGDTIDALPIFERVRSRYPAATGVLSGIGTLLFNLGYVRASVGPALQAVRYDPSSVWKRDTATRRLAAAGMLDEAFRMQRDTEQLLPDHPLVLASRRSLDVLAARGRGASPGPGTLVQTARVAPWAPAATPAETAKLEAEASSHPYSAYILAKHFELLGNRTAALEWLARAPLTDAKNQWSQLFWPDVAGLRTEPAFFRKMADLGLLRWWVQRRQWPDFCTERGLKYSCTTEAAKLGYKMPPAPPRAT